ncbi:putative membrane protein [Streptomyces scabiei 87.22]|uniref:Putative membrane protein n=1 Tax=Streptomyces scabiei (strain 87.22) TaxID=680198 RepID=C9Z8E2_STRSW|nr:MULTISPECIES: hypothetical protein [Streptomyces]MBP5861108.1 hypothetical protein [Streptomyces sp. LBUM 1484]MBP5878470.1 hypothetical protein [Streptomyces sp. LBUM 1477]MBP5886312.1 hypothetical protein [Streptomyces sp. LBUM 1487]MBP5902292.1 hypothetical protein [Streptomyces sp. LBUM 1488]MDW8475880.1 hypothetical protein [Streptomyces scabiei]
MIVALIIACEVGFWVLLALALAVRYLLKRRRTSVVLLLCEPVLELVLFVVTAIDLKNGAEPSWEHGIAALYIGFTVGYGHYMIGRMDAWAAYRLGGGPRPEGPPKYGLARARYEGKLWVRTVVAAGVALVLLQLAVWYVGDDGNVDSLRSFQWLALRGAGIHGLVALAYTIWPKKDPAASDTGERVTVEKERAGR